MSMSVPKEIREIETDGCKESNDCTGPAQDSGGHLSVSDAAARSLTIPSACVCAVFPTTLCARWKSGRFIACGAFQPARPDAFLAFAGTKSHAVRTAARSRTLAKAADSAVAH